MIESRRKITHVEGTVHSGHIGNTIFRRRVSPPSECLGDALTTQWYPTCFYQQIEGTVSRY